MKKKHNLSSFSYDFTIAEVGLTGLVEKLNQTDRDRYCAHFFWKNWKLFGLTKAIMVVHLYKKKKKRKKSIIFSISHED
jgi:hypothetical protein